MQQTFRTLTGILLMFLSLQGVSGADTLRIHLTFKHRLDAEGRTQGYTAINQKFYTPEQVLFREISYDENSSQISNYIFYFHEAGRLVSAEAYNASDSLLYVIKHRYDAEGREAGADSLIMSGGRLIIAGRVEMKYNAGGKPVQRTEYTGSKKTGTVKISYDPAGNLTKLSAKYKPASGKPVKSESRLYSYNADRTLSQVAGSGKDMKGNAFANKEMYTYNPQGLKETVTLSGTSFPMSLVKTYRYLPSGSLSLYQEADPSGKISLLLQYDYKKHFMDRGTQVSRLGK
jgi:hypothetical protein